MIKYLEEAVAVDAVPSEPAENPVTIILGRFQPCTVGHLKMYEAAKKLGHPVVVYAIRGEKSDPKKSPFPHTVVAKTISETMPNVEVREAKSAFFGDFLVDLRPENREPVALICGADRVKSYSSQIDRYRTKLNLSIDIVEIARTDEEVSATKVREALLSDDQLSFNKMTDKGVWPMYREMQRIVKEID